MKTTRNLNSKYVVRGSPPEKDCKDCDCNQKACDLCDATNWNTGSTCTGVIGAATITQKVPQTFNGKADIWATGNSNYTSSTTGTDAFHKKDNNNPCYNENNKKIRFI